VQGLGSGSGQRAEVRIRVGVGWVLWGVLTRRNHLDGGAVVRVSAYLSVPQRASAWDGGAVAAEGGKPQARSKLPS